MMAIRSDSTHRTGGLKKGAKVQVNGIIDYAYLNAIIMIIMMCMMDDRLYHAGITSIDLRVIGMKRKNGFRRKVVEAYSVSRKLKKWNMDNLLVQQETLHALWRP